MRQKWHRVYVGIGSNLGHRRKNIRIALSYLKEQKAVKIIKVSSLHQTKAVGGPAQGNFLNAAIYLRTTAAPSQLLKIFKSIEKRLGRPVHRIRWAPRTLDLDILLYDNLVLNRIDLVIPHALMHKRRFVLLPLVEIAPRLRHPVLKKTIKRLLRELKEGV